MAINLDDPKSIFNTMTWKPLYDGTSMEEAVEAVGRSLMEADRQKEEWLANHKDQQLVQSSEVPDENNIPSDTKVNASKEGI